MIRGQVVLVVSALLSWESTGSGRAGEPCPASQGVDQRGYLVEVHLCAADSRRCSPHGRPTYKAELATHRQAAALTINDIPDGYVISGGELFTSSYDLATRGFNNVHIARHGDPGDYCGQHFFFDMGADWSGNDAEDSMNIEICVCYEKWPDAVPRQGCVPPS